MSRTLFCLCLAVWAFSAQAGEPPPARISFVWTDGYGVDGCTTTTSACGKPSADAMCVVEGHLRAVEFSLVGNLMEVSCETSPGRPG